MKQKVDVRILRVPQAAEYLGVNVNYFNRNIRPYIDEVHFGPQMRGFDRFDLDRWIDETKRADGCPMMQENVLWVRKTFRGSKNDLESGTSTSESVGDVFAKALEQIRLNKRRCT